MHHGAEICLLRDLYRATGAASRYSRLIPPSLTYREWTDGGWHHAQA